MSELAENTQSENTQRELQRLARGSAAVTLYELAGRLKGPILVAVLYRFWSAADYGRYIQVMVLLTLAMGITSLQLHHALVRFLPGAKGREECSKVFFGVLSLTVLSNVILVPMVCLIALALDRSLGPIIVPIGVLMVVKSVTDLFISSYRADERMGIYSALLSVGVALDLAAVAAPAALGWSLVGVLGALLAVNVVFGLCVAGVVVVRFGAVRFSLEHLKRYLSFALPMTGSGLAHWVVNSSDRWLIVMMLSTTALGYYHPAYMLGTVLLVLPRMVGAALPPMAARLHENRDRRTLEAVLSHYWKLLVVVGVPFVFGALVMQRPLLEALTTAEVARKAAYITPIVALSTLLLGGIQILGEVMKVNLRTGYTAKVWAVSAVVNVGANLVLIPIMGIIAAALSTLAAFGLAFVLICRESRRYVNLSLQWSVILRCVCASVPQLCLFAAFKPATFPGACALAGLGCVIYVVGIVMLSVVKRAEVEILRGAFKPSRSRRRKTMKSEALFYPGPMHLFWSVGIYYVYHLARDFSVTLVLRGASDEDERKVRRALRPREVKIHRLHDGTRLAKHRAYVRAIRTLFSRKRYELVMADNDVAPFNAYLMDAAARSGARRICYQTARTGAGLEPERRTGAANAAHKLARRWHIPTAPARVLARGVSYARHLWFYYVGPLLAGYHTLPGRSSMFMWSRRVGGLRHSQVKLVFEEAMREQLVNHGVPSEKIIVLSYPGGWGSARPVREALLDDGVDAADPLNGLRYVLVVLEHTTGEFGLRRGSGTAIGTDELKESWTGMIRALKRKFPHLPVVVKPHPAQSAEDALLLHLRRVFSADERVHFGEGGIDAHNYFRRAEVVAGESSNVLWLCSCYCPRKTVISFDLCSGICADSYRNAVGVHYFSDLRTFECANLESHTRSLSRPDHSELFRRIVLGESAPIGSAQRALVA